MQRVVGPREQVLGVVRKISSAFRRLPRKCANRIKRSPPAQGNDFTSNIVDVAYRNHGAKIAGSSAMLMICSSRGYTSKTYINGIVNVMSTAHHL
jgi:hypothetical protein